MNADIFISFRWAILWQITIHDKFHTFKYLKFCDSAGLWTVLRCELNCSLNLAAMGFTVRFAVQHMIPSCLSYMSTNWFHWSINCEFNCWRWTHLSMGLRLRLSNSMWLLLITYQLKAILTFVSKKLVVIAWDCFDYSSKATTRPKYWVFRLGLDHYVAVSITI